MVFVQVLNSYLKFYRSEKITLKEEVGFRMINVENIALQIVRKAGNIGMIQKDQTIRQKDGRQTQP